MDEVEVRVILLFQVGLISDKKRKKTTQDFQPNVPGNYFLLNMLGNPVLT